MTKDTIIGFADPVGVSPDPLTDILRKGARDLLARAIEAEVTNFWPRMHICPTHEVANGLCATAIFPSARS